MVTERADVNVDVKLLRAGTHAGARRQAGDKIAVHEDVARWLIEQNFAELTEVSQKEKKRMASPPLRRSSCCGRW